jgi:hypothetical protein
MDSIGSSCPATLLYADSDFGVEVLFPKQEVNRIQPGKTIRIDEVEVGDDTTGLETAVVIAVKGEGPLMNFASLAQKRLPRTRDMPGAHQTAMNSPLGKLMQKALSRQGNTRSVKRKEVANYTFAVLPIQVEPGKRPAGAD